MSRHRRLRLPVLLAAAGMAAAVLPAAAGSAAVVSTTPALTLSQARAQVASLNARAEKVTEAYDGARQSLTGLRKQEAVSAAALRRDQQALAGFRQTLAASAAAAYRSGALSATTSLVSTGSAQTFIDQTAGLDEVAQYQATQVAAAAAAQRQVDAATVLHNAQITLQKALVAGIASKRQQVQSLLAASKNVLARLTAAQQRRLAAQQAAENRRAVSEATSAPSPAAPKSPTYTGPATGQASAAVKYAYAQLGKPYVWGGAGPSSFDCSGLTMMAWNAAGVSLPHNAAMQQSDIPAVSLSALQPGDLIFFGSPAFHVAIYIGGGNMIQAPHTGADVEITPVSYMSPSGAGRP